jgi:hypothetical protein
MSEMIHVWEVTYHQSVNQFASEQEALDFIASLPPGSETSTSENDVPIPKEPAKFRIYDYVPDEKVGYLIDKIDFRRDIRPDVKHFQKRVVSGLDGRPRHALYTDPIAKETTQYYLDPDDSVYFDSHSDALLYAQQNNINTPTIKTTTKLVNRRIARRDFTFGWDPVMLVQTSRKETLGYYKDDGEYEEVFTISEEAYDFNYADDRKRTQKERVTSRVEILIELMGDISTMVIGYLMYAQIPFTVQTLIDEKFYPFISRMTQEANLISWILVGGNPIIPVIENLEPSGYLDFLGYPTSVLNPETNIPLSIKEYIIFRLQNN